jgi:hypothetical protein
MAIGTNGFFGQLLATDYAVLFETHPTKVDFGGKNIYLDTTKDFAQEAWVKFDHFDASYQFVLELTDGTTDARMIFVTRNAGERMIQYQMGKDNSDAVLLSDLSGRWLHLYGTFAPATNTRTLHMWDNGTVRSVTGTGKVEPTSRNFTKSYMGTSLRGEVALGRVWNGTLPTLQEMADLRHRQVMPNEALYGNIVTQWVPSKTQMQDTGPNALHGVYQAGIRVINSTAPFNSKIR